MTGFGAWETSPKPKKCKCILLGLLNGAKNRECKTPKRTLYAEVGYEVARSGHPEAGMKG